MTTAKKKDFHTPHTVHYLLLSFLIRHIFFVVAAAIAIFVSQHIN